MYECINMHVYIFLAGFFWLLHVYLCCFNVYLYSINIISVVFRIQSHRHTPLAIVNRLVAIAIACYFPGIR